jgi:hypothetical protein
MTYQPPRQVSPAYQQPAYGSPPQQPPRRNKAPLILGIVGGILVLVIGLAVLGAVLDDGGKTDAPTGQLGAAPPKPADVKLTAKITEQTCYGEAGCAVTWHPEVAYTGPAVAAGKSWTIVYQVTGVESGTTVGRIVMDGTTPAKQNDKHARTAAKTSKITLKVTGVELD